jgi:hypothetical protein
MHLAPIEKYQMQISIQLCSTKNLNRGQNGAVVEHADGPPARFGERFLQGNLAELFSLAPGPVLESYPPV